MTNELEKLCQIFQQYQYAHHVAKSTEQDDPAHEQNWNAATTLYLNVLGDGFELMDELEKETGMYVVNAGHIVKALERIVGEM